MNSWRPLLLTLLTWIFTTTLSAQMLSSAQRLNEVRVDDVPDEELISYYNKGRAAGLTNEQMSDLLRSRGLPEPELVRLQQRLTMLGQGTRPQQSSVEAQTRSTGRMLTDTLPFSRNGQWRRDTTIFGSELYTNARMDFAPNLRIATPANYVLGPGDELLVNVYGYSEKSYNLTVSPEGTVYITNMGPVKVAGLNVDEAGSRIRGQMGNTIYKAVKSGQTRVTVSLGNIRSIQVTIVGQAMQPGTYTVPSLATVFNALYQCGGPNDYGSYRSIEVVRQGKLITTVDLYDFLHRGSSSSNILLHDQDVIRIPYTDRRILVRGALRREGKFELKTGEALDDLVSYTGGFSDSAYRNSLKVERLTDSGFMVMDVLSNDFSRFEPKSGDRVEASRADTRYLNRVSIAGAVLRPGNYQLTSGLTLKQLIEKAGGLRPEAYTERATLLRKKSDLSLTTLSFSPADVVSGKEVLSLQKEDEIRINSLYDLKDRQFVLIEGEVRNPGRYLYSENMTAKDLILLAGGFTTVADSSKVEVSRRLRNQQIDSRDYQQTEMFSLDLKEGMGGSGNSVALMPFDLMLVRPLGDFESQRSIYIDGMVRSPGRYVLQRSTERVSQLLERTGGFRGGADSTVLNIKRLIRKDLTEEARRSLIEKLLKINGDSLMANPRLRETYLNDFQLLTVDLNKVRQQPGGNEDLVLEDGDLLSIARATSLVKISGEVYNPTALPFDAKVTSAKKYVRRSGGFTTNARKGRLFVLYPDGRTGTVGKFLFFKSYPKVTPRSEVFVPGKDLELRNRLTTGEWVAISSILATLTTLVVAITQ